MPSHPRARADRSLKINSTVLFQTPQVRAAQCFRRDADFELALGELGDGQAGAVDADAVAEGGVGEDFRAVGDGKRGAAAAGAAGIVLHEVRDDWVSPVVSDVCVDGPHPGLWACRREQRTAYGLDDSCEHDEEIWGGFWLEYSESLEMDVGCSKKCSIHPT